MSYSTRSRPVGKSPSKPTSPSSQQQQQQQQERVEEQIIVAVRSRPLSAQEAGDSLVISKTTTGEAVRIERLGKTGGVLKSEQGFIHEYSFDKVFPESCGQEVVYKETTRRVVEGLLLGKSGCVFSYGQTGSGKTYTMMGGGDSKSRGIIPRALEDIFAGIDAYSGKYEVNSPIKSTFVCTMSFMEIYNEQIFDLLTENQKPLNPCEDPNDGRVHVLGVTQEVVGNVEQVLKLLATGTSRRRTNPTAANQVSSRSHAVLQIDLERIKTTPIEATKQLPQQAKTNKNRRSISGVKITKQPENKVEKTCSRLSLIDLAGSERAAATQNRGLRLREGANINQSLLALANCINALSAGSTRVKYRDSKLTHILKSSLIGDCQVTMIANVSPSHRNYEESHNTLKIAARAKNIKVISGASGGLGGTIEEGEEAIEENENPGNIESNNNDVIPENNIDDTTKDSSVSVLQTSTNSGTLAALPPPPVQVPPPPQSSQKMKKVAAVPNKPRVPPTPPPRKIVSEPLAMSSMSAAIGVLSSSEPALSEAVAEEFASQACTRAGVELDPDWMRAALTVKELTVDDQLKTIVALKHEIQSKDRDIQFLLQRISELETEVLKSKMPSFQKNNLGNTTTITNNDEENISSLSNRGSFRNSHGSTQTTATTATTTTTTGPTSSSAATKRPRSRRLSTGLVNDLDLGLPSKMPRIGPKRPTPTE